MENKTEVKDPKKETTGQVKEVKKETAKSNPQSATCLVVLFLSILVIAAAVFFGFLAEKSFGGVLLQKLPMGKYLLPQPSETAKATGLVIQKETSSPSPKSVSPSIDPSPPPDTADGEYILPFSNTRAVVTSDLTALTPWELKVGRNEIYARHGRPFVHKDLSCYFAKQSWYTTDLNYSDKSLSSLEISNATVILNYEKSINSPLVNTDSGCK